MSMSNANNAADNVSTILCCSSSPRMIIPLDPRIVSGSVGSIVSAVVTTPFEVAKVKLQHYEPPVRRAIAACRSTRHPTGPVSMLRYVIAKEGVQGAYAGLAPTVIMSIPNYLLYLISYDEIADAMRKHTTYSETSIPLAGGALARLIATSCTAPFELLRTRHASMEGQEQSVSRVWKELSSIVRNDGVTALYRGIMPQLLRDVPFAALYMLCLERFREITRPTLLTSPTPQKEMGFEFCNAAAAGMVAASCTAPLDLVKTRFQSHQNSKSSNMSIYEVVNSIIRKDGVTGLWRGNQARMMKVAPQYAIMISCYEVGKKVLA